MCSIGVPSLKAFFRAGIGVLCCAVPCRLHSVVAAAWQLHSRRLKLCGEVAEGLSPTLTHMRVVKEAQAFLDDLSAR
jgi:hypothetical protein